MKKLVLAAMLAGTVMAATPREAEAVGCISGGLAGGLRVILRAMACWVRLLGAPPGMPTTSGKRTGPCRTMLPSPSTLIPRGHDQMVDEIPQLQSPTRVNGEVHGQDVLRLKLRPQRAG